MTPIKNDFYIFFSSSFCHLQVQVWFSNRRARLRKQLNSQQVPTFSSNLSTYPSQYDSLQMSSAQSSFPPPMQSWTQSYSMNNNQQSSQSAFNHLPPPMVASSAALSPASLSSSPVHGSTSSAPPTTSTSSISGNNMNTTYNYSSIVDHQNSISTSISSQNHLNSATPPTPPVSATSYPFSYSSSFEQAPPQWRSMQNKPPTMPVSGAGFEWDAYR